MQLTVASHSDKGPVRTINQDVVAFWEPAYVEERRVRGAVALIADGVGGSLRGEVASKLAAETAVREFRMRPQPGHQGQDLGDAGLVVRAQEGGAVGGDQGVAQARLTTRPPITHVMVLEPSAFFRKRLAASLQGHAWQVTEAQDRFEAQALLEQTPVDVMIAEMADGNGSLVGGYTVQFLRRERPPA